MASEHPMQLGMVGLGRMGSNIVRRLVRDGHRCVVYDVRPEAVAQLEAQDVTGAPSLAAFVAALERPRAVWLMVPAGLVQTVLAELVGLLDAEDVVVDGGNSHYRDTVARAATCAAHGLHYVDCGTSGGVWGLERGYCLMIGGDPDPVRRLEPIFRSLAPGAGAAAPTPQRRRTDTTAPDGYLHCGPSGAGHFVKMVHNGIEYGMMGAIAEGLSIVRHADPGGRGPGAGGDDGPRDASPPPYEIDVAEVAELWRRGSVIGSWLLDLTADALAESPDLASFAGRVADSGEGRWTVAAAIEAGVPAPVITSALLQRFESRGLGEYAGKLLSAMRHQFGGHAEIDA